MNRPDTLSYLEVSPTAAPVSLLLKADPCETTILSYLDGAWCFAAKAEEGAIVGACVAKPIGDGVAEIFNISVAPSFQQGGIGSRLLIFALDALSHKRIRRVELGTGTFGHQLGYYQRHGFRVRAVVVDHFLNNYPEPIVENGIQHKDMLRLYLDLV
ncbi:GNAT family N-acetyltransferase [Salinicola endophyticus]|uniref:GNAT family N-acetyltransferase n=1 Tax=Salinicola endophyticus TaxID=1949083 RepID=UPI000DA12242|nr:GNAT family N-acetyltransferase [Salinicola endophyticus]